VGAYPEYVPTFLLNINVRINYMWFAKHSLYSVLLLCLAGCASKGDVENMQRDMDEMKPYLLKMGKELGELKDVGRKELEKGFKGFRHDIEAMRKETADLQANLDSHRVDIQAMGGKVDDVLLHAQKPADDLALFKEDHNRRITAFEERLLKLEKEVEELPKKLAEARPDVLQKDPEALYRKGLDTFRAGETQKARELLTRFLEIYPDHELSANARYWVGETYYGEKKYDSAILEFQEVIKKFHNKEKAPAAMLKQAMAFKELGDMKSARYVLKKLLEDFPAAEEVKPAKERLKEWK
jgi:tol-pal system protein YbgF